MMKEKVNQQEYFLQVVDFIQLRQQQKQNLNSLSKLIQKKEQKNTENEIKPLFSKINEQLQEGHTILQTQIDEKILQEWQNNGWISMIEKSTNDDLYRINTPIVMQKLEKNQQIYWLHRHWFAEKQLANQLLKLRIANQNNVVENIDKYLNNHHLKLNEQQKLAILSALQANLTMITGGPGTGKTTTVANLVAILQQLHDKQREIDKNLPPLSIALTAPTGKASQRMQESLMLNLQHSSIKIDLPEAKTLHRLLGIGIDGVPRYHTQNPLPDDLVIVDEASMLGLELASQLVNAIKPNGRLILLGDANQLSAVDAGSVLADLCQIPALAPYHVTLVETKRFDEQSYIGKFAQMLTLPCDRASEKRKKIMTMQNLFPLFSHMPCINIHNQTNFDQVFEQLARPYIEFFDLMKQWYQQSIDIENAETIKYLFKVFNYYRILSAGHQGELGAKNINGKIAQAFFKHSQLTKLQGFFYHGLPVMITRNDYQLGLFNGDIGICLLVNGKLWVCFPEKNVLANRLSLENCEPAFAMTIHKSQGSEFEQVAVCIDMAHKRLLCQELIYTGVTRAKEHLTIVANQSLLEQAITQKGNRQTGLALHF